MNRNSGKFFDVEKTNKFFGDMLEAIDQFATDAETELTSLKDFTDEKSFSGNEAMAAKKLTGIYETELLNDILKLQEDVKSLQSELMEKFSTTVDADKNARIAYDDLKQINTDFYDYYTDFKDNANSAKTLASSLNTKYSGTYGSVTIPDFTDEKKNYKDLCNDNFSSNAYLGQCKKLLIDFDDAALELIREKKFVEQIVSIASRMSVYNDEDGKYDSVAAQNLLNIVSIANEGGDNSEYTMKLTEALLGTHPETVLTAGDPINMSTGNFIYDHEDLLVLGEIPVSFHRYYNSLDFKRGVLGQGFIHNYEMSLEIKEKSISVRFMDGEVHTFKKSDNNFIALNSPLEKLLFENGNYKLTRVGQNSLIFDEEGQLKRIENRNGRGISFSYDNENRLSEAKADNGSFLNYFYDFDGRLIKVEDNAGRKVLLYFTDEYLSKVVAANGAVYEYKYGQNGGITELVNSREILAVKNIYDEKNRVVSQHFIDGSEITLEYKDDENAVVMTERNGSVITYFHDELLRNTKVAYEDKTTEEYEYNTKNQRVSYKDRNGNFYRFAYDNRGNLTQKIEPDGRKTNVTYDSNNNVISININGKALFKCDYDANGNVLKLTNSLNNIVAYSYDEAGRPVKIVNPTGGAMILSYDSKGNVASVTDAMGGTIVYKYDLENRVEKTFDQNGNSTEFIYDKKNQLVSVKNAEGSTREYDYDGAGRVVGFTDYDGNKIAMTYNALGKLESYTDKEGNKAEFAYDCMWNINQISLPNGGKTIFNYDQDGNLKTKTNPLGGVVSFSYDANGNMLSQKDEEGNTTEFQYDNCNRVIERISADGATTTFRYNDEGLLESETNALGYAKRYEYDILGRKIAEINEQGARTEYTYEPGGNIASIKMPNGASSKYAYDAMSRLVEIKNPDGSGSKFEYDSVGNLKSETDAAGNKTIYTYDCMNRLIGLINPLGGLRSYDYDVLGQVTRFIDENGAITTYEYTKNGQLKKVIDAMFNETSYEYDAMGQLVKMTQTGQNEEEPQETYYERDYAGNIVKVVNPLKDVDHYTYDLKGQLISRTDRDGYKTDYTLNGDGIINNIAYSDGRQVKLSYNALNQLEQVNDWLGTTNISLDELGRPLSVTDAFGKTVGYEWGLMGEKKAVVYPDGTKATYSYNSAMELETMTTADGLVSYSYNKNGQLAKKVLPEGTEIFYTYNGIGRIAEINQNNSGVTESYIYDYDSFGNKIGAIKNRSQVPEDNGQFNYQYDLMNRLIAVTKDGQPVRNYSYDAFGNRIASTDFTEGIEKEISYTYNRNNQLVSKIENGILDSFTYDKRGNLIGETLGENIVRKYSFDAAGYMVSASDLIKNETETFAYNGLGKRMAKTTALPERPELHINYTLDLTRDYHNLLSSFDVAAGAESNFFWDSNVVAASRGSDFSYYLQDDLGSPMEVFGRNGSKKHYAFDEFGNNLIHAEERFTQAQPFGYTGYQLDEASGFYFAQARKYDATNGRFVSEDFVKGYNVVPFSMNHYGYCWNRPLDLVDLNGLWAKWIETTVKVVSITAAVVAVGAVVVCTGGAAAPAAVIAAGALTTGVVSGFVNEQAGGSYANGFLGGLVAGGIQSAAGTFGGPVGTVVGGAANGLGSAITDSLDNLDSTVSKKKSTSDVVKDAGINAVKGMLYSLPAGAIQAGTPGEKEWVDSIAAELMKNYNANSSNVYGLFYGLIDNGLIAMDSMGILFAKDENGNYSFESEKE